MLHDNWLVACWSSLHLFLNTGSKSIILVSRTKKLFGSRHWVRQWSSHLLSVVWVFDLRCRKLRTLKVCARVLCRDDPNQRYIELPTQTTVSSRFLISLWFYAQSSAARELWTETKYFSVLTDINRRNISKELGKSAIGEIVVWEFWPNFMTRLNPPLVSGPTS